MRRIILAAIAAAALSTGTLAQQGHSHGDQGPHGGKMQDVVGIHAELLIAERTLTVHLYDEAGTPVPSAGYTASALVGSGTSRQVVLLTPGVENALTGTAVSAVARGTPVTLQLKNPAGRIGQARFWGCVCADPAEIAEADTCRNAAAVEGGDAITGPVLGTPRALVV